MATNKIYIQVDFQADNAQKQIDALNARINAIGSTTQSATKQASQGISSLSVSIDQVTSSIGSFAQQLAGLGIAALTREMIGLGAQLQQLKVGFENAVGGMQGWKELHEFAEKAGFDFQALIQNANDLRNAGLSMQKVVDYTKAFADQSVRAGQGQEGLNRAINAAARIAAAGYVNSKSLIEFRSIGLEPTKFIADKLNISIQELRRSSAQLNSGAVLDLIVNFAKTQSAGEALTRRNDQLVQSWGALKTAFGATSEQLVTTLKPAIDATVQSLIKFLELVARILKLAEDHPWFVKLIAGAVGLTIATKAAGQALTVIPPLISGLAATVAQAVGGLGVFEAMMVTITAGLEVLGPALLVVGAAYAAWKVIPMIYEAITHEGANAAKASEETRQGTLKEIDALEEKLAVIKKVKQIDIVQSGEGTWTQQQLDVRKQQLQAEIDAAQQTAKGLLDADIAELERQAKTGANILAEAQRKYYLAGHEAIRALDYEYEEHFRSVSKSAKGTADVQMAAQYALATIVKKHSEEMSKANDKVVEETLRMTRKVSIAAEELYPDQTFAARKRVQEAKAADEETEIRAQTLLRRQDATRASYILLEEARQSKLFKTNEAREMAIAKLKQDAITADTNLSVLGDQQVYEHRLKSLGEIHKLEEEERLQNLERQLEDQVDYLQKTTNLRIQYAQADMAQTLPMRLHQIETVRDLEIQGTQDVAQARIASIEAEVEHYRSTHGPGLEQVQRDAAQQEILINRDAQAQIQADRLNAWKEGNDAVIEEQKKVYDSLKSAFDKVWDVLTDRNKSIWTNIGNALRTALTSAVKDFATSRVAASLTQAVTGRGVTFPGGVRGFGGNAAQFEGLGAPPVMQALAGPLAGASQGLGVAAIGMNTAAQAHIIAAQALTVAAGAIASGTGGPGGAALGAINSASGSISTAAATMPSMPAAAAGGTMLPGLIGPLGTGGGGATLPGMMPSMGGSLGLSGGGGGGGLMGMARSLGGLRKSFGMGDIKTPVVLPDGTVMSVNIPWASLSSAQKFSSIAHSQGAGSLEIGVGSMLAMSGLQKGHSYFGGAQTIAGGTLTGLGLATLFPHLLGAATTLGLGAGALGGLGLGIAGAGLARGGKVGLGMSIGGAALTGAVIGSIVPGIGTAIGAGVGALVGATAGLIRMFSPTLDERIRSEIRRVYGIDITQKPIRDTIAQIATSRYGGNLSLALYSQDVQDIVRLYALNTGANATGLARPMYPVNYAQSQAGGLQLQPVYSGGQLVANPYTGTTTAQMASLSNIQYGMPPLFIQLNPQQANDLFTGRVVQAIGSNPGAVAQANTTAAVTGMSRSTQTASLLEPLTVTR